MLWVPIIVGVAVIGGGIALLSGGGGGVIDITSGMGSVQPKLPLAMMIYKETDQGRMARRVLGEVAKDPRFKDVQYMAISASVVDQLNEQAAGLLQENLDMIFGEGIASAVIAAGQPGTVTEASFGEDVPEEDLRNAILEISVGLTMQTTSTSLPDRAGTQSRAKTLTPIELLK